MVSAWTFVKIHTSCYSGLAVIVRFVNHGYLLSTVLVLVVLISYAWIVL